MSTHLSLTEAMAEIEAKRNWYINQGYRTCAHGLNLAISIFAHVTEVAELRAEVERLKAEVKRNPVEEALKLGYDKGEG